jgi:hypothetical protein
MAYHNDLLDLASELARDAPARQVALRRSVSTAYYAIFHLLISETITNWNRQSSRNSLGRMFDHGMMKRVSKQLFESTTLQTTGADPGIIGQLQFVAKSFCELQMKRHTADYDYNKHWDRTDALRLVLLCRSVFTTWDLIKNEDIAQEYLVSLLIKPRD